MLAMILLIGGQARISCQLCIHGRRCWCLWCQFLWRHCILWGGHDKISWFTPGQEDFLAGWRGIRADTQHFVKSGFASSNDKSSEQKNNAHLAESSSEDPKHNRWVSILSKSESSEDSIRTKHHTVKLLRQFLYDSQGGFSIDAQSNEDEKWTST